MPLTPKCIGCKTVAVEEYHWYDDNHIEHIWQLCEDCCDFAISVVESVSNLEEEITRWQKLM